jgi:hypothetical protein
VATDSAGVQANIVGTVFNPTEKPTAGATVTISGGLLAAAVTTSATLCRFFFLQLLPRISSLSPAIQSAD